jgi:hypothetical protein
MDDLKPCPACRERKGELVEGESARFPYRVKCAACGYSTEFVKLQGVAVRLWNEAKPQRKGKAVPPQRGKS